MKTFGKIAGGLGLLLLLSSPFTFAVSSPAYSFFKAALGVALLGVWFFTRERRTDTPKSTPGQMGATARSGFYLTSSALIGVITIALLFALNFIVSKRAKTYDLTSKKIYSLAPQTLTTLKELKEPIKAIGFLPAEHPAWDQLDAIFKKYASESEKFTYEFKDPRKNPDLAAKYQLKEGQTTVVLVKGETHSSLNVISEQELTNALIKLSTVGQQKIYFVVGHGEWPLQSAPPSGPNDEGALTSAGELKSSLLQEGYSPEELNLAEKNEIPKDASAVVIAAPKAKFSESELATLDKFLSEGGRLLYFHEQLSGKAGLEGLLAKAGIQVDTGMLADSRVNPAQPYIIVSAFFADHEITRILKSARMNVQFPTASGLTQLKEGTAAGVNTVPVVLTSPYAWEESEINDSPSLTTGEKSGAIPVVIAATRDTKEAANKRFDEGRVVVFGDGEILVDALWGHEPNRNLVLNAIAWTSNQAAKITIRPPDRDISIIDVNDDLLAKLRFVSMDLLPLLLVGVGLSIWLTRRNK